MQTVLPKFTQPRFGALTSEQESRLLKSQVPEQLPLDTLYQILGAPPQLYHDPRGVIKRLESVVQAKILEKNSVAFYHKVAEGIGSALMNALSGKPPAQSKDLRERVSETVDKPIRASVAYLAENLAKIWMIPKYIPADELFNTLMDNFEKLSGELSDPEP